MCVNVNGFTFINEKTVAKLSSSNCSNEAIFLTRIPHQFHTVFHQLKSMCYFCDCTIHFRSLWYNPIVIFLILQYLVELYTNTIILYSVLMQ